EDGTTVTQVVVTIGHNDGGAEEFGIRHLAGDKLAADQVVKLLRILFQATDIGRPAGYISRPDGLVGLLGAFLATVHAGLLRQVAITELFLNKLATAGYGIQIGRAHV